MIEGISRRARFSNISKKSNAFLIISAAFFITGNLVGAGILGLPIQAGFEGFIPAMLSLLCFKNYAACRRRAAAYARLHAAEVDEAVSRK